MADEADDPKNPAELVLKLAKDAAGGGDKDKAAPEPPPNRWVAGVERYRRATTWMIGAFVAVIGAALGTGPFIVLDQITTQVEAIWTLWGIAAALGGTLIIVYVGAAILTPVNTTIGKILEKEEWPFELLYNILKQRQMKLSEIAVKNGPDDGFSFVPDELKYVDWKIGETQIGWRQHKSPEEAVYWTIALERAVWSLDRDIDVKLASEAGKDEVAASVKRRDRIETLFDANVASLNTWNDRARYHYLEERYKVAIPILLLAAGVVAAGMLAYLGSARINITSPTPATSTAQAVQIDVRDGAVADDIGKPSTCKRAESFDGIYFGGNGTAENPWDIETTPTGGCHIVRFTLTEEQGDVYQAATVRLLGSSEPKEGCSGPIDVDLRSGTGVDAAASGAVWVARTDDVCIEAGGWTELHQQDVSVVRQKFVGSEAPSGRLVEFLETLTSDNGAVAANFIGWMTLGVVLTSLGFAGRGVRAAQGRQPLLLVASLTAVSGVVLAVALATEVRSVSLNLPPVIVVVAVIFAVIIALIAFVLLAAERYSEKMLKQRSGDD